MRGSRGDRAKLAVGGALALSVLAVRQAAGADPADHSTSTAIYLDMRTSYARIPAGSLGLGFGPASLLSRLLPAASISIPAATAVSVDLPLTVDVTDSLSIYGGVSGNSTRFDGGGWSDFVTSSWNIGLQAQLYDQNGGFLPSVTLQTTLTQSLPPGPLATTSFSSILEFDYALDEDATRGLLTGFQNNQTVVASDLASIRSYSIGYVGGYYQWPNNWKFTGRIGIQHFEGATLLNASVVRPFTQPVVRLDLDRMDDDDNRLFGVTAEVSWVPKPAYTLTLRTPIFLSRP